MPGTGESVGEGSYFEAVREIRECGTRGELAVLLVHDSKVKGGAAKYKKFKDGLFKNESLAVAFRVFRCLELDTAKSKVAKQQFGKKLPCFLVFDAKGRQVDEVAMAGYRAKASSLLKALTKVSKGHGKLPLVTFIKKYRSFLNDLDKLEGKKTVLAKKRERLFGKSKAATKPLAKGAKPAPSKKPKVSRSKLKKLEADEKSLAEEEKVLLAQEKDLLAAVKAYAAPARGGVARPVAKR